jgi:endoglucanase
MRTLNNILGLILLGVVGASAEPKATDPFEQNQKLDRGVNVLGYDPIWRNRGDARFQEKHFRLLKEAGFNSIRVNLHGFRHMDKDRDWELSDAWFNTVDWIVQNAREQGLMVILDLHEYNAMGEDAEGNKPKFLAFWRQVSAHFAKAPENVLFEILNEPSKKMTPEVWNAYLKEALAIIREKNPARTVIIGPAQWNSFRMLDKLELPAEDRNLIVTIHYYLPMSFTHQGASWVQQESKTGVEWTGTEAERGAINKDFDTAAAWARKNNRPLFLGEFGAYDKGPMESRARYTAAVARTAETRGWSWAYWQFDSDFILFDMKKQEFVQPILEALAPAPKMAK